MLVVLMNESSFLRRCLITVSLVLLTACGGGSDNSDNSNDGTVLARPILSSVEAVTYTTNEEIDIIRFANSGGGSLTDCSMSNLPVGLSVSISTDSTTCEISGIPTATQDEILHRILAVNDAGSSIARMSVAIYAEPALQQLNSQIYEMELPIAPLRFTNNGGGMLTDCRAESLPEGLQVKVSADGSTCEITGTPSNQMEGNYATEVTAINRNGSNRASVLIGVSTKPSLLEPPPQVYVAGQKMVPFQLTNLGGGILSECLSDDLPEGLDIAFSLGSTSCEISGTPTIEQNATQYQVTAINGLGSSQVSVDISVISQQAFITTWQTDSTGLSDDNQISINIWPEYDYDYQVDWGDGTIDTNVDDDITHTYSSAGIYTVTITGTFPQTYFDPFRRNDSDAGKLLTIEQWGTNQWRSMYAAFANCEQLVINATDSPDLTLVTDMTYAFRGATNFVGDLSQWNVSSVQTMNGLFASALKFNSDISQWDVSSVTDMSGVFFRAASFNSDLSQWNVSSVNNMEQMFYFASVFNSDLSQWNVSSITNMSGMFSGAAVFAGELIQWDVSSVIDMSGMFSGASVFNSELGMWDVSSVKDMSGMFSFASKFNQDISQWNVASVKTMHSLFARASSFNSNISQWDTSSVTTMESMFSGASAFNGDLSQWDVSSVTDMSSMFSDSKAFDQDLGAWNVESVSDMELMFDGTSLSISNYDALLEGWSGQNLKSDVVFDAGDSVYSSVGQSARNILENTFNWTISDGGIDEPQLPMLVNASDQHYSVGSEIEVLGFLNNGGGLITDCSSEGLPAGLSVRVSTNRSTCEINGTPAVSQPATTHFIVATNELGSSTATVVITIAERAVVPFITTWKTDNFGVSDGNQVQISVNYLLNYDYQVDWGDGSSDSNVTGSITHTYASPGTYTVAITGTFPQTYFKPFGVSDSEKLVTVEQWGSIQWLSAFSAFANTSVIFNATDTPDMSQVTDMGFMFSGAIEFNSDISSWDVSGVTDMGYMFSRASNFNVDISNWDVSSVIDMKAMFNLAVRFNQNIGRWHPALVEDMSYMFDGATSFNSDISGWNVSSAATMKNMFRDASAFNQDLSLWDVSSVITMEGMFSGARSFNQNIGQWDVSLVNNMSRMFERANAFNQGIGNWNVSSVIDMSYMFLRNLSFNQSIGDWDVSKVKTMNAMFSAANVFNQELSNWDVSSVTDMTGMFNSAVSFNHPLELWDVSSVKTMSDMFFEAEAFNQDISDWDISSVKSMFNMLSSSGLSTTNYDALLLSWSTQNAQNGVMLGAGNIRYSNAAQAARDILIETYDWNIFDGGAE